jgi:hypothetical protein
MVYPDEFEQLWQGYPRRIGNNPKRRAYNAYKARLKEYDHDTLINGLKRYRRFCEVTGIIHTSYVMHASTFLGLDENFLEDWEPPEPERIETIEQKGRRLGINPGIGESMDAYKKRIAQAR